MAISGGQTESPITWDPLTELPRKTFSPSLRPLHATTMSSSDDSNNRTAVSPAIIPLSVLCAGLILGGIAAVLITRRIARARLLLELRLAAEAKAAEERLGVKPVLVDVYVGPSPALARGEGLPWPSVQVSRRRFWLHAVCSRAPAHRDEAARGRVLAAPAPHDRKPPGLRARAACGRQRPPALRWDRDAQPNSQERSRRTTRGDGARVPRVLHRHV